MTIFDTTEALGVIAIEFSTAPKIIKELGRENHLGEDWIVICREDKREEGEWLAMKIQEGDYEEIPMGNYVVFITYSCF